MLKLCRLGGANAHFAPPPLDPPLPVGLRPLHNQILGMYIRTLLPSKSEGTTVFLSGATKLTLKTCQDISLLVDDTSGMSFDP